MLVLKRVIAIFECICLARGFCRSSFSVIIAALLWNEFASTSADPRCLTYLSENCFTDLSESIQCRPRPNIPIPCSDPKEFCRSLSAALNCTIDILSHSCEFNRKNYDAWFTGMLGVQKHFCSAVNRQQLQELMDHPKCWNMGKFLTCIEEKAGITHLIDLMRTPLDAAECNKLMISSAICIYSAENSRYRCQGKSQVIVEALTVFFAESKCINDVTKMIIAEHCESKGPLLVSISVAVTLVVGIIFSLVVACFLKRRKIITIDTRFKLYEESEKSLFSNFEI